MIELESYDNREIKMPALRFDAVRKTQDQNKLNECVRNPERIDFERIGLMMVYQLVRHYMDPSIKDLTHNDKKSIEELKKLMIVWISSPTAYLIIQKNVFR